MRVERDLRANEVAGWPALPPSGECDSGKFDLSQSLNLHALGRSHKAASSMSTKTGT
jgi:hypothetical protein